MSTDMNDAEQEQERRRRLLEERLVEQMLRGGDRDDDDIDHDDDSHDQDGAARRARRDEDGLEGEHGQDGNNNNNPLRFDDDEEEVEPLLGDAAAPDDDDDPLPPPPLQPPHPPSTRPPTGLSYVNTSFLLALGWFYYAMRTRQQFYLATVYLASSKLSLAVLGNACIALAVAAFEAFVSVFLDGGLRLQEAEGLQDFFRWNVTETCLALTMFRSEITIQTTVEFLVLIWIKCVHHVAGLRENHFRMTQEAVEPWAVLGDRLHVPTIPKTFVKLFVLLLFLQVLDVAVFQHASDSLNQNGPSVNILFKFETVILLVSAWRHALLLHLHLWDGLLQHAHDYQWFIIRRLLHPWKEYRATLVFAVELQAQAFQFLFYLAFFGTVLTYYGMPINLFREVYMSFAALRERVLAFLKYRKLMGRMNRFDNATDDLLEEAGRVCIICRDDMHPRDSKVLPGCKHVFHKSCLREWLVQQQTCPTCRSDIDEMARRQAQRQDAAGGAEERRRHEEGVGAEGHVHDEAAHDAAEVAAAVDAVVPPPPQHEPQPLARQESAAQVSTAATATAASSSAAAAAVGTAASTEAPVASAASSDANPASSNLPSRTTVPLPQSIHQDVPPPLLQPRTVSPWDSLLRSGPTMSVTIPVNDLTLPSPLLAPRRSWNFPSLYRVDAPSGTTVWTFDDDVEQEKESDEPRIGTDDGPRSRDAWVTRHLTHGTIVLCTSVSSDADSALYLQVPDGWISVEDVVHVADVSDDDTTTEMASSSAAS